MTKLSSEKSFLTEITSVKNSDSEKAEADSTEKCDTDRTVVKD